MPPIASVTGLRKTYRSRRAPVVAVDGISFSVDPGEMVGLLGPNGAGKTTTIKCMCTLVRPDDGTIEIDGVDATRRPREAVTRVAAVLEGNRNIYWRMSARENLEFFAALQGLTTRSVRADIDELIERFSLGHKRDVPAMKLSKGMQQKLALACAFVKRTPLLVLDEPTLGLDVEASHELRAILKEINARGERTILFSSHDMAVVQEVCERVLIVTGGRLVTDDRVENLLALFTARAYTVTLSEPLSAADAEAVRARFAAAAIDVSGTSLEVELSDPSAIYDVIDLLRAMGAQIEGLARREPNLEQVFLHIVRSERAPEVLR